MKFCQHCRRILDRHIVTGEVLFICACGNKINGDAYDTLIDEEYASNATEESHIKFSDFIDGAAYDPVNFVVKKDCEKCKKDYMKMIRIGDNKNVIYTCDCGFKTV
jgi:DNA-directed RNA polymerase subunit M/transcription elongation factor TFIIS